MEKMIQVHHQLIFFLTVSQFMFNMITHQVLSAAALFQKQSQLGHQQIVQLEI